MIHRQLTIDDVRILPSRGPWKTKSGGHLRQRFQIPLDDVQARFMTYPTDPGPSSPDIRGLRMYTVDDIPNGTIGANEFHKVRTEIAIAHHGRFRWACTDLTKNRHEYILDQSQALLIPPMILHTYECLSDSGRLIILASTTFDPNDSLTHDSFPAREFEELALQ